MQYSRRDTDMEAYSRRETDMVADSLLVTGSAGGNTEAGWLNIFVILALPP